MEIRFLVKYFPSPWDYPRYNTHNVLTVQWYKKLMKFLFIEHTKKVLEKNEWFLESPNNALFAVNSDCSWRGPENLVCWEKIWMLFCLLCLTFNSQLLDWRLGQKVFLKITWIQSWIYKYCNFLWLMDTIFKADMKIGKLPKSLRWLLLINEISDMKANLY